LLAWLAAGAVGVSIKDYFPSFHIGAATFTVGIALMVAFGLITGAWPALTAMRLRIVDALRRI
jgi:ABC-type antimicrobial peptide transport system permease subunit